MILGVLPSHSEGYRRLTEVNYDKFQVGKLLIEPGYGSASLPSVNLIVNHRIDP